MACNTVFLHLLCVKSSRQMKCHVPVPAVDVYIKSWSFIYFGGIDCQNFYSLV